VIAALVACIRFVPVFKATVTSSRAPAATGSEKKKTSLYFASIGLGYLMVEIM